MTHMRSSPDRQPNGAHAAPTEVPASATTPIVPSPEHPLKPVQNRASRLTLAEELVLVALDDRANTVAILAPFMLELAVTAALVMELALDARIDTDVETLYVLSRAPTGHALLDAALSEICAEPQSYPVRFWLSRLSQPGPALVQRVIRTLVDRGVLQQCGKSLLRAVGENTALPTTENAEHDVKRRMRALLDSDEIPDTRDVLLVGLLHATGLFDLILSQSERIRLDERITHLAHVDEISRELISNVHELQCLFAAMDKP